MTTAKEHHQNVERLLRRPSLSYATTTGHVISYTPEAEEVTVNGENIEHSYWEDQERKTLKLEHNGVDLKVNFLHSKIEGIIESLVKEKLVLNPFVCHNLQLSDQVEITVNKKGHFYDLSWNPSTKSWKNVNWHRQGTNLMFHFKTPSEISSHARFGGYLEGGPITASFDTQVTKVSLPVANDCRVHYLDQGKASVRVESLLTPAAEKFPIYKNDSATAASFCYLLGIHIVPSLDGKSFTGVLIAELEEGEVVFWGVRGDLAQYTLPYTDHHVTQPPIDTPTTVKVGANAFFQQHINDGLDDQEEPVVVGPFPESMSKPGVIPSLVDGKLGAGQGSKTAKELNLRSWPKDSTLPGRIIPLDLERKLESLVRRFSLSDSLRSDYQNIVKHAVPNQEIKSIFYSVGDAGLSGELKGIASKYSDINEKSSIAQIVAAIEGTKDTDKVDGMNELNMKRADTWLNTYLKGDDNFKKQQKDLFKLAFAKSVENTSFQELLEGQRDPNNEKAYYHPDKVIADYDEERYYQGTVEILVAAIKQDHNFSDATEKKLIAKGLKPEDTNAIHDIEAYVMENKLYHALAMFNYVTQKSKIEELFLLPSQADQQGVMDRINNVMTLLSELERDGAKSATPNLLSSTFYNTVVASVFLQTVDITPDATTKPAMVDLSRTMVDIMVEDYLPGAPREVADLIEILDDMRKTKVDGEFDDLYHMFVSEMLDIASLKSWQDTLTLRSYNNSTALENFLSTRAWPGKGLSGLTWLAAITAFVPLVIVIQKLQSKEAIKGKDIAYMALSVVPLFYDSIVNSLLYFTQGGVSMGARMLLSKTFGRLWGMSKLVPVEDLRSGGNSFLKRSIIKDQIQARKSIDFDGLQRRLKNIDKELQPLSENENIWMDEYSDDWAKMKRLQGERDSVVKKMGGNEDIGNIEDLQKMLVDYEGMDGAQGYSLDSAMGRATLNSYVGSFLGITLSTFGLVMTSLQLSKDLHDGADKMQITTDALFLSSSVAISASVLTTFGVELLPATMASAIGPVAGAVGGALGAVGFVLMAVGLVYQIIAATKQKKPPTYTAYDLLRDYVANQNGKNNPDPLFYQIFYMSQKVAIDHFNTNLEPSAGVGVGVYMAYTGATHPKVVENALYVSSLADKSIEASPIVSRYLGYGLNRYLCLNTDYLGYTYIKGYAYDNKQLQWVALYLTYDVSDYTLKFLPRFGEVDGAEKVRQQQWIFEVYNAPEIINVKDKDKDISTITEANFLVQSRYRSEDLGQPGNYLTYGGITEGVSTGGNMADYWRVARYTCGWDVTSFVDTTTTTTVSS
ncbi:hypothetical protein [Microscilla marina]|uniref:Uncharacterized protein n=1 Tax=Microscilla marina ATCC 23134 TaxID=313606 RepID=A1ZUL3_MICM2|nr:hypothetical protein [Microscilla marina]EAY25899.1 hypothetical protein M23134_00853 [Microscilla marina ATCC 23134]